MKRILMAVMAGGCLAWCVPGGAPPAKEEKPAGEAQIIEVAARAYQFTPAEIHVQKGAKVRLKVHSTDATHGIKLSLYPEGGRDKSSPGLVFDNPQGNGRVEKGEDQILDFVARQAGTYEFKCAKVCGMHHRRMRGKLIVEP